jgi:hypothetical protein
VGLHISFVKIGHRYVSLQPSKVMLNLAQIDRFFVQIGCRGGRYSVLSRDSPCDRAPLHGSPGDSQLLER